MKTVFIINPTAGNGRALKQWLRFEKTISFPYEHILTEFSGHASAIASSFKDEGQRVLLIGFGGDGTLREIVVGAAGAKELIIGSVAAGSGNDFARSYGAFKNAQAIEQFLEAPRFKRQDLGEFANGLDSHFVSSSGIGFDAEITIAVNQSSLKKKMNQFGLGKIAYYLYVIKTLVKFETFTLTVQRGEESFVFHDVWLATVSNQPYFGGGMKISPTSCTDDGLLELTVVHQLSRLKLLLVFGTVFSGAHTRFKEVSQMSSPEFRLSSDKSVFRHVDGDDAGMSPQNEMVVYAIRPLDWSSIN